MEFFIGESADSGPDDLGEDELEEGELLESTLPFYRNSYIDDNRDYFRRLRPSTTIVTESLEQRHARAPSSPLPTRFPLSLQNVTSAPNAHRNLQHCLS